MGRQGGALRPRAAAAALLALLALPAAGAPEEYVVESAHTYPTFAVGHLGISMQRGRFDRTSGRIVLDREAGTGTIDIAIDATSVSTGSAALDAVLRSDEFFNVARFPQLTFRAARIDFENGAPRRAAGELTLAGVTRPVEVAVRHFGCTRLPFLVRLTCGADVTARIRRSDFGMDAYSAFVGDDVELSIQLEAVKQEPPPEPPPSGG